jgi:hypothetical protein
MKKKNNGRKKEQRDCSRSSRCEIPVPEEERNYKKEICV